MVKKNEEHHNGYNRLSADPKNCLSSQGSNEEEIENVGAQISANGIPSPTHATRNIYICQTLK
jgi:hypothetical protein